MTEIPNWAINCNATKGYGDFPSRCRRPINHLGPHQTWGLQGSFTEEWTDD